MSLGKPFDSEKTWRGDKGARSWTGSRDDLIEDFLRAGIVREGARPGAKEADANRYLNLTNPYLKGTSEFRPALLAKGDEAFVHDLRLTNPYDMGDTLMVGAPKAKKKVAPEKLDFSDRDNVPLSRLLSPYSAASLARVKDLNLSYSYQAKPAALRQLVKDMPNLERLNLFNAPVVEDARALAGLKRLKSLDLSMTSFNRETIKELAKKHVPLTDLRLGGFPSIALHTQPDDAMVKDIVGIKSLRRLDLSHSKVTDKGIKELSKLPNLRFLELRHYNAFERGDTPADRERKVNATTKAVESIPKSVLGLDLTGTPVTNESLAKLRKDLMVLKVGDTQITDQGVKDSISKMGKLTSLQLGGPKITDASMGFVPKVEVLGLKKSKITDEGLTRLQGKKELVGLDLDRTKITGKGLEYISRNMTNMEDLGLARTPIKDADLVHLRRLPKLNELDLTGTQTTDKGLAHLAQLKSLKILNLRNTKITEKGFEHIGKMTGLERLEMSECVLGGKEFGLELHHLRGLKNLKELEIRGNFAIKPEYIKLLQEILPHCRIISDRPEALDPAKKP